MDRKYLPSFIIYSVKITVFKVYSQPELYFKDLAEISIQLNYFSKSSQDKIVICRKLNGRFYFSINGNPTQRKHLTDKAIEYNRALIIKDNNLLLYLRFLIL